MDCRYEQEDRQPSTTPLIRFRSAVGQVPFTVFEAVQVREGQVDLSKVMAIGIVWPSTDWVLVDSSNIIWHFGKRKEM